MLPSKGGTARSLSGGMGSVENSEMYVACNPSTTTPVLEAPVRREVPHRFSPRTVTYELLLRSTPHSRCLAVTVCPAMPPFGGPGRAGALPCRNTTPRAGRGRPSTRRGSSCGRSGCPCTGRATVVAALEVQLARCGGGDRAGLLSPGVGARPQVDRGAGPVGVGQVAVVDVLVGRGGVGLRPGGVQWIGPGVGPTTLCRAGVVQEHRVEVGVGRQVGVGRDQSAADVLPAGHLIGPVDGHRSVAIGGDRDGGALAAGGRSELFAVGAVVDQAGVAGADVLEAGADGAQWARLRTVCLVASSGRDVIGVAGLCRLRLDREGQQRGHGGQYGQVSESQVPSPMVGCAVVVGCAMVGRGAVAGGCRQVVSASSPLGTPSTAHFNQCSPGGSRPRRTGRAVRRARTFVPGRQSTTSPSRRPSRSCSPVSPAGADTLAYAGPVSRSVPASRSTAKPPSPVCKARAVRMRWVRTCQGAVAVSQVVISTSGQGCQVLRTVSAVTWGRSAARALGSGSRRRRSTPTSSRGRPVRVRACRWEG